MKSIIQKYPIMTYPLNAVFPPFTKDKQSIILNMAKYLDVTQRKLAKRFVWFIIIIVLLWAIVTKRITVKKIRRVVNMLKMMIKMLIGR